MSVNQQPEVLNKMANREKIASWIKTTRIQTAMVTALSLWVGYLTVKSLNFEHFMLLGSIGLLVHIWGFTLNEVEDYKYDRKHSNGESHPIAQGHVHAGTARIVAWMAAIIAVTVCVIAANSIVATLILMASFIPGYLYDKYSKVHWWSNGYLSIWAMLMVLTGATAAGTPTVFTGIIGAAIGIQIFVQVIQGDLKDFDNPEESFAKRFGVKVFQMNSRISKRMAEINGVKRENGDPVVMRYSKKFTAVVYSLKLFELGLIFLIVILTLEYQGLINAVWAAATFTLSLVFLATLSMFMVYVYDRDRIKQMSSAHELTSILLLAAAMFQFSRKWAIVIAVLPVIWYIATNRLLYSEALNPDI